MLKTKKNFALTASALAVGYAGSAMAQVELGVDAATIFANEFTSADSVLSQGLEVGSPIAINADSERYARFELSQGTFKQAPVLSVSGVTAAPDLLLVEGGASASYAIFSIETSATSNAVVDFGDNLEVSFNSASTTNVNVTDNSSTVSVTLGMYETQAAASAGGTPLAGTVSGDYFTWGTSLTGSIGGNDATAEVTEAFELFQVAGNLSATTASLGSASLALSGALVPATGSAVSMSDLATSATLTVTGAFAGAFASDGTTLLAGPVFNGETATEASASAGTATVSLTGASFSSAIAGACNGDFTFQAGGSVGMVESDYAVTCSFNAQTGVTLADISGSFGSIVRNGTNVDIPYITTYSEYNQRLILVNRGVTDADYSITFTSEDGVTTADAGSATGTIDAMETLIIPMTDIVTITGGTRTAGQISIVAPAANMDVATTQVTLADKSTDTVVLD